MPIQGIWGVHCTRSDGATVTVTLNFDPATGAPLSGTVVNTADEPVEMVITREDGTVVRSAAARAGTRTYTPQQMAAVGLTNVSQLRTLTVDCA